ncbi:MAG: hypothetical protein Q9227_008884 [Pyrenula ochraceoflavens]
MKYLIIAYLIALCLSVPSSFDIKERDPIAEKEDPDPGLYWIFRKLDDGQGYVYPPENTANDNGKGTLTYSWPDDRQALALVCLEAFQTLFTRDNLEVTLPRTCRTDSHELAWTRGQYVFYASLWIRPGAQTGVKDWQKIPFWAEQSKNPSMARLTLPDVFQYYIAVLGFDAMYAILVHSSDDNLKDIDRPHYGYANYKVGRFGADSNDPDGVEKQGDLSQRKLPPIPPWSINGKLQKSFHQIEYLSAFMTPAHDGACHVAMHTT